MTALDIEGTLAAHPWGFDDDDRVSCWCGAKFGLNMLDYYAHVAAVLREQIAAWLGSDDAEESVYEALDPGGHGWAAGDSPSVRETIRALADQVAPSRVPGEES